MISHIPYLHTIKIGRALICALYLSARLSPAFCATVTEIPIPNSALGTSFPATVILPRLYAETRDSFPVIYLLHGYSGGYKTFAQILDLSRIADSLEIIIVCPDGNANSWYLDSPVKKNSRFATYIAVEVVAFIDNRYRTLRSACGRAIAGTSMGGHGALTLLARYPDTFCCGCSISGILDLTQFPGEWDIERVLGPYPQNRDSWKRHSFISCARILLRKDKLIIIDCGKQDFALAVNRAAHDTLSVLAIPHQYSERPGDHSFRYVQKVLPGHCATLTKFMRDP